MKKCVNIGDREYDLTGRTLETGDYAPDFRLTSQELMLITLDDLKGQTRIFHSFPSIDTGVCNEQVKDFDKINREFTDFAVIGVSLDLPFAQKRFCEINGITHSTILSDYRYLSFALNYGLLIKELRLIARSVFVVDKYNVIHYREVVYDQSDKLNLEKALYETKIAHEKEYNGIAKVTQFGKCRPCEGGVLPLSEEEAINNLKRLTGWELSSKKNIIEKNIKFKNYDEALFFLNTISAFFNEQNHHPDVDLNYNKLKLSFTTNAVGGLTENDFIMAGLVDEVISNWS